jgi:hypothetical protein
MLRHLDPHSVFFDPDQYAQMKQMETSTSKGFGTVVSILPGRVLVLQTHAEFALGQIGHDARRRDPGGQQLPARPPGTGPDRRTAERIETEAGSPGGSPSGQTCALPT